MANSPNNPFDFTDAVELEDIWSEEMQDNYRLLEMQNVPWDMCIDLFFEALGSPLVSDSLKRMAADHLDTVLEKEAKEFIENFFRCGRDREAVMKYVRKSDKNRVVEVQIEPEWNDYSSRLSLQADHVWRMKGETASPLLREIALEVGGLTKDEHENFDCKMDAVIRAYQRIVEPPCDFSAAKNADDVVKIGEKFLRDMYIEGVNDERAVDRLYKGLAVLDSGLRQRMTAIYILKSEEDLKGLVENYKTMDTVELAGEKPAAWDFLRRLRIAAQHAINVCELKGAAVDPLTREVAKSVLALPADQREEMPHMILALMKSNIAASSPFKFKIRALGF